MQIVNRGIMFLTINGLDRGAVMGTPEEWANRLAKRLEDKRILRQADDDAVAMRREIVAEKLPVLWEELIKEFREYCKAYNERIRPERKLDLFPELDGFVIKPDAKGEIIRVHLDRGTKRISVATAKSKDWYSPSVEMTGNGNILLKSDRGGLFSVSEMTGETFDSLFEE
ncbi:MAG: hypothetical protein ABSE27_04835 [Acidobacteriaceae bacterium]